MRNLSVSNLSVTSLLEVSWSLKRRVSAQSLERSLADISRRKLSPSLSFSLGDISRRHIRHLSGDLCVLSLSKIYQAFLLENHLLCFREGQLTNKNSH